MEPKDYCLAYRRAWRHKAFNNLLEAGIWNFLYQNASWKKEAVRFNGSLISLERGQLIIIRSSLAKQFCTTEKTLRNFLKRLEQLNMIKTSRINRGMIITIINYDLHQTSEDQGQRKGSERAAKGHLLNDSQPTDSKRESESYPQAKGSERAAKGQRKGICINRNKSIKKNNINNLDLLHICDFNIDIHLSDNSRKIIRGLKPEYDLYELIKTYNSAINSGKMQVPDRPEAAFIAWCKKWRY